MGSILYISLVTTNPIEMSFRYWNSDAPIIHYYNLETRSHPSKKCVRVLVLGLALKQYCSEFEFQNWDTPLNMILHFY